MKKRILCIILGILCVSCLAFANGCDSDGGDNVPVVNVELDEYNSIIDQMKEVFVQTKATKSSGEGQFSLPFSSSVGKEDEISSMFSLMQGEANKKQSEDHDYFAYGFDISTMTARIAGYAANNFFKLGTFYDVNILMDYGGNTLINTYVTKENNVIKTYLYTQQEKSSGQTHYEYGYTEIKFNSKEDFKFLVLDYIFDSQNNAIYNTMVYASNQKDFFLVSGSANQNDSNIAFFNVGGGEPSYIIEGDNTSTINALYLKMQENFSLSKEDKSFLEGLYNAQQYSVTFSQVVEAKEAMGITIDMSQPENVDVKGFVRNNNAQDMVGRKTLQAFVDDGQSVEGKTLTIPKEFNYLSGGIYFEADIDTLVIPSTVKGVVVYDRLWNYSILDDSLCYLEPGDEFSGDRYRAWGGMLFSYLSQNGEFEINNAKLFKKFILLDENGQPTNQTKVFALDQMGNLWIRNSRGENTYLWGFVSEPTDDTLKLPSPSFVVKGGESIEVNKFYSESFIYILQNTGKLENYANKINHIEVDAYTDPRNPNEGSKVLVDTILRGIPRDNVVDGFDWELQTFTINNVKDNAVINLREVFCNETVYVPGSGVNGPKTVCKAKIDKVIINGQFNGIQYINGYYEMGIVTDVGGFSQSKTEGDYGQIGDKESSIPEGQYKIVATHAINKITQLNGNENANFLEGSVIYGQEVIEIDSSCNQDFNSIYYPDVKKVIIKKDVETCRIFNTLFKVEFFDLPEDRKLEVEFENIANVNLYDFEFYDLTDPQSTRLGKIKYNVTEMFIDDLSARLTQSNVANWLKRIDNIEYATPSQGEQFFFSNFQYQGFGYVCLKQQSSMTEFTIDDAFLTTVKNITGLPLNQITINLCAFEGISPSLIKLDVSQSFINANGDFPVIEVQSKVELSSAMSSFVDLTVVIDNIHAIGEYSLKFNGSMQRLISCLGGKGEQYLAKVLNSDGYYFEQIITDDKTIYKNVYDKILVFNDGTIEVKMTFSQNDAIVEQYYFKDLTDPSKTFSQSDTYYYDDNNEWGVEIFVRYKDSETYEYNGMTVYIPRYEFSIKYYNGIDDQTWDRIYVYGTDEQALTYNISLHNLPTTFEILEK